MNVAIIVEDVEFLENISELPKDILLEFRIDLDPRLINCIKSYRNKFGLIATLRSTTEGGKFDGDREETILEIISSNPKYVDLEFDTDLHLIDKSLEHNIVPVISKHDYSQKMNKNIQDFITMAGSIHGRKDIVVKYVGKPVDSHDMLSSLKLAANYFSRRVILGVGRHGNLARTMRNSFNQEFVFGSTKLGVIPKYSILLETELINSINIGLIGRELSHSLSPEIHNVFLKQTDLPGHYHLFDIHNEEDVLETIDMLSKTRILGINVTIPYKKKVLSIAKEDKWVKKANAANTLKFDNGEILAFNTDISGFGKYFDTLEEEIRDDLNSVLIFGAGGAARAVAIALMSREKRIILVNRSEYRKEEFEDEIIDNIEFYTIDQYEELREELAPEIDIYINATSVGYGDVSPTSIVELPMNVKLVIDLNYAPERTILVRDAIEQNIRAVDGKGMLFHQAADAFELWTDQNIDREAAFKEFLRTF